MNVKHLYLKVWEDCLYAFKEWPPNKVEEWAKPFFDAMCNGGPATKAILESGGPLQRVVPLLIPECITTNLTQKQRIQLFQEIEVLIENGKPYSCLDKDFDWRAAKVRLDKFLDSRSL